ncbi:hypothetical protein [Corynebacterium sp. AOP12-C2-36]|uniref:hypothetical protein n=1 Tax=Corynebacterium sp. AOP12-C2-36 TaxID=3457723 RepID=UPI004034ECCC
MTSALSPAISPRIFDCDSASTTRTVEIPAEMISRIVSLNTRRDVVASGDIAMSAAGLPIDLNSPEHQELTEDIVELYDDLADVIEDAEHADPRG